MGVERQTHPHAADGMCVCWWREVGIRWSTHPRQLQILLLPPLPPPPTHLLGHGNVDAIEHVADALAGHLGLHTEVEQAVTCNLRGEGGRRSESKVQPWL